MSTNASAAVGGAMSPADEDEHRARLAEQYADEAEAAVGVIEEKLAGVRESLAAKKDEAKRLRREANEARANTSKDGGNL